MTKTLFFRFLSGIVLCFFTGNLFAINAYQTYEFNEKVFAYHFDRADREIDPASWMREAQLGMALAVAEWERQSVDLYTDPEFRAEAGVALRQWSEEELEKRFVQWLFNRFFGDAAGEMVKKLDAALDDANRQYTYHTDDNGNIQYDETGAPLVIRPNEARSIEEDRALWLNQLRFTGEKELQQYQNKVSSLFPELLAFINEENRAGFETNLKEVLANSVINKKSEFEALFSREERLFIARRTGDLYSLRKGSESQSAAMIVSQLIHEAENNCAAGIASLEARIEAAKAGTGDLALAGEEWLAAFQEQFDYGLKAWADAEERFLVRRAEWELNSEKKFEEGRTAWEEALKELEKQQKAWEKNAFKLFGEGEKIFEDVSEKLNAAIAQAKAEFESDARIRINNGTEQVRTWAEMYITCLTVMAEAKESVDFWLPRFSDETSEGSLDNGSLKVWAETRKNSLEPVSDIVQDQIFAGSEIIRWCDIYSNYKTKAQDAMTVLENEFGIVLGMDKGALDSVLYLDSEMFFLDEYQLELLRAKSILSYWENRLAIAEAVNKYAEDVTAGRVTEAEGIAAFNAANANYEQALQAYNESLTALNNAGKDLERKENELEAIVKRLNEAEQELDEINRRYAIQLEAYNNQDSYFVKNRVESLYNDLLKLFDNRLPKTYYTAYLNARADYLEEEILQYSLYLLEMFVLNEKNDPVIRNMQLSLLASNSSADWYYLVTGKEQTEEDRAQLVEEGVHKRLEREIKEAKEAWEAAVKAREEIEEAEAGDDNVDDKGDAVIDDASVINENYYKFLLNTLAVYRQYAAYAPGLQKELAQFALKSLHNAFLDYDISDDNKEIPDIESAAAKLFEYCQKNDVSVGNTLALLLLNIDMVIEYMPTVIKDHIENWKDSFIDYMASKAVDLEISITEDFEEALNKYQELIITINSNIKENIEISEAMIQEVYYYQHLMNFLGNYKEKLNKINSFEKGYISHWRYFNNEAQQSELTKDLFIDYLLLDSSNAAKEAGRILKEALEIYLNKNLSENQSKFIGAVNEYLNDAEKQWEEVFAFDENIEILFNHEYKAQQDIAYRENELMREIERNGQIYLIMLNEKNLIKNGISVIYSEIEKAKANYNTIIGEYKTGAAVYAEAASNYEKIYSDSKTSYKDINVKRLEYEKQDAIQRWAGTAYLYQSGEAREDFQYYKEPAEELEYSRERYIRAQEVLAVLKGLYNSETSRPFADSEYGLLYREYQESFSDTLLVFRAKTEVYYDILEKQRLINESGLSYMDEIFKLFPNLLQIASYYNEYPEQPQRPSALLDYLYVKDTGGLGLKRNAENTALVKIDQEEAIKLFNYFSNKSEFNIQDLLETDFVNDLLSWAQRMISYDIGKSINTFNDWSLALDYILDGISDNNPDIKEFENLNKILDMGADADYKIDGNSLGSIVSNYHKGGLKTEQETAWTKLNDSQKSDLEFLAILLLTGGASDLAEGFFFVSNSKEMEAIVKKADSIIQNKKNASVAVFFILGLPIPPDTSAEDGAKKLANSRKDIYDNKIQKTKTEFPLILSNILSYSKTYDKTKEPLSLLLNTDPDIEITWENIEAYLYSLNVFTGIEMAKIGNSWNKMTAEINLNNYNIKTIEAAINILFEWNNKVTNDLENDFNRLYFEKEIERKTNQDALRESIDKYINNNESGMEELTKKASEAYGNETASIKDHYFNLGTMLVSNLQTIDTSHIEYVIQSAQLAEKLVLLVKNSYQSRYEAELESRQIEWDEQIKDLKNKYLAWQEACSLIIERGAKDWYEGFRTMQSAYVKWQQDFIKQYNVVKAEWDAAYMESLQGKEQWINQAIIAANDALNGNLKSMLGAEDELGSPKFDLFIPSSTLNFDAAEEADLIMKEVLSYAGIASLYTAVNSVTGSADTVLTTARRGVSGLGTWNLNQAKAAAKELAWNNTNDLAKGKMAMLAVNARESINESKRIMEERVTQTNINVDNNIDNAYLLHGGWKRTGNKYSKDIVVHSTVATSAITDNVVLDAYRWFVMDYWDISVDLSDSNLETLDYQNIQYLIDLAQKEVEKKELSIFGANEKDGELNFHIGEYDDVDMCRSRGEYGRLFSDLQKWNEKQSLGIALMNAMVWDKPIWDSRGSGFDAPSIRSAVDFITSVVSAVVGVVFSAVTAGGSFALAYGINMSDDFIFGALDVAYSDKGWDDVGFEFGKKSVITLATSAAGAAFSGASNVVANSSLSPIGKTVANTAITGTQAVTVGTATSALNAVTYHDGKWDWDRKTFDDGFKSSLVGAAVGMTSTFTAGTLNIGLEGFYGKYYNDGSKLSSLIGGLAGQGLNYALGGDFTLNVFNLGFLNDKLADSGLIELHFGRDGVTANLGSGGVDTSLGGLASAFKGLEAWKVNYNIWTSDSASSKEYIVGMRSLYSGSEKDRTLYDDILNNKAKIEKRSSVEETETVKNDDGTKTIYLGSKALNDESRFGLSVYLSHEAYRDGEKGTEEQQRIETNQAVAGHINTALGLMGTYGKGSISSTMVDEATTFSKNYTTLMSDKYSAEDKEKAMLEIGKILYSYDSSADYWRMQYNGTLVNDNSGWLRDEEGNFINSDGTRTKERTDKTIGAWGIKNGLLKIMFGDTEFTADQISQAEIIIKLAGIDATGNGIKGQKLNMDVVMSFSGNTITNEVFNAYYNNTIDYQLANKYNIDLIFNKKGNWKPNTVFSDSQERYDQLVKEKYGFASEQVIRNILENKYLQTINTDNGKTVNVLRITENNPYISLVLGQRDPAFVDSKSANYNFALNQSGCNFLSSIAVPQLLTGNVLSATEINSVWNWATTTHKNKYEYMMIPNGFVNDVNQIANHVLQNMDGYNRYNLTITRDKTEKPSYNANFVAVKEKYAESHFVINRTTNKLSFNPWPYLNGPNLRYDGVFLNVR